MKWQLKVTLRYAAIWFIGVLLTIAAVTTFIHVHYAPYQTSAQSWQHSFDRWPRIIFVSVAIGVTQLLGLLASISAGKKLKGPRFSQQPSHRRAALWYCLVIATGFYLLWTLTIALGLWLIWAAMALGTIASVLIVVGLVFFGLAEASYRVKANVVDR